jgi:uncharacterized membrane protein (DUF485 family)
MAPEVKRQGALARGAARRDADRRALARARTRIGVALTACVVVLYFGFIAAVGFAPQRLGRLIMPGLSLGILAGALVIVVSWLLTWVYVRWANTRYDPRLRALRD